MHEEEKNEEEEKKKEEEEKKKEKRRRKTQSIKVYSIYNERRKGVQWKKGKRKEGREKERKEEREKERKEELEWGTDMNTNAKHTKIPYYSVHSLEAFGYARGGRRHSLTANLILTLLGLINT